MLDRSGVEVAWLAARLNGSRLSVTEEGFEGPTTYCGTVTYGTPGGGVSGQIQQYYDPWIIEVPGYTPVEDWNPFQFFDGEALNDLSG